MERLVELFVQSARYGETGEPGPLSELPQDGGHLDEQGIEHGVEAILKMMQTEDGIRMGINPAATFVCLAMALEEKPLLQAGAARCYEKSLELFDKMKKHGYTGGSWERATVLQQLGSVYMKQNNAQKAAHWLDECAEECVKAEGHPRDAVLFDGAFNTQQTRLDFVGTVEKLLAKAYYSLGDQVRAKQHYDEVQRLSKMQSQDAVEREEAKTPITSSAKDTSSNTSPNDPKVLWAAAPDEDRTLSEYRFVDEGSTVLLILDLNDHLGIGEEASNAVHTLSQFRVKGEGDQVDVRVRLRRENGKICQFRLLLQPLINEIIPEDTVPKLKGREGKRRLEVKLFKRNKTITWNSDMVKSKAEPKKATAKAKEPEKQAKPNDSTRLGTMLNPLSAEELARLPRPGVSGGDNRPSSYQSNLENKPVLLHKQEAPRPVPKQEAPLPVPSVSADSREPAAHGASAGKSIQLPAWVARVEERRPSGGGLELDVHLSADAGEAVGMNDLELDGDEIAGLRLSLSGASGSPLKLSTPPGTDCAALKARWRRKTRVLELRLPDA